MKVTETIIIKDSIATKAEQITTLALVAQAGNTEELTIDKIESLFDLFIDLSIDISKLTEQIKLPLTNCK